MRGRIITSSAEETHEAGAALARCVRADDVVLLTGDLGAGKTVFAKGFAEGLGIDAPVTSPTFNILLVYRGRLSFNHFDLYRLENATELVDIDYFATLESGGVTLVEWGDRFVEASPDDHLAVALSISGDTARDLACTSSGSSSRALLECWLEQCLQADLHVDREASGS